MNLVTPVSIVLILAFLCGALQQEASAQKSSSSLAKDECCSQPGRIESAKVLLAQSEDFKLKASQFHVGANASMSDAKKLRGQADKLRALTGATDANAPNEYKANLQAFKDHAVAYRAHLDKVEKELGHCHASEAAYDANLNAYSIHSEIFHMPNIKPPHICGRLQVSEAQASHMANSMRIDQARLVNSEAELANSENKLAIAMQASMNSDAKLYHRSQLAEEERKLAGEFAGLKTEYELLQTQHDALFGTKAAVTSKTVHAKVK